MKILRFLIQVITYLWETLNPLGGTYTMGEKFRKVTWPEVEGKCSIKLKNFIFRELSYGHASKSVAFHAILISIH